MSRFGQRILAHSAGPALKIQPRRNFLHCGSDLRKPLLRPARLLLTGELAFILCGMWQLLGDPRCGKRRIHPWIAPTIGAVESAPLPCHLPLRAKGMFPCGLSLKYRTRFSCSVPAGPNSACARRREKPGGILGLDFFVKLQAGMQQRLCSNS